MRQIMRQIFNCKLNIAFKYREMCDVKHWQQTRRGFEWNRETTSADLSFNPVIRLRRVCSGASLGTHFIMKQTKS